MRKTHFRVVTPKWGSFVLLAYVAVALVVHVPWGTVLYSTFVPNFSLKTDYVVTVVAVLGTTIEGQPLYSAIAIETGLALHLVFHQPLRQTEGFLRSIADVLGVDITIPGHTTLSRRGGGLRILLMRLDRAEPLHLLVDSTGLKIYGEGEWLDQKLAIRSRRRWRKLHLGIDAVAHEIVASELTPDDVGDVSEMPVLRSHAPRARLVEGFSMQALQERETIARVTDWLSELRN